MSKAGKVIYHRLNNIRLINIIKSMLFILKLDVTLKPLKP